MKENEKIREIRKALGFTQQKLADELEVSKQYLSRVENGLTDLSKEKVMLLCGKFGVSTDWLLCERGQMFIKDNIVYENLIEDLDNFGGLFQFIGAFACYYKAVSKIIKNNYPNAILDDEIETAQSLFVEDVLANKIILSNKNNKQMFGSEEFKIKTLSKYYFVYVERCEKRDKQPE